MNYTKSVEKWDVFEFSAEGTTADCLCRPCGRSHLRVLRPPVHQKW